MSSIYSLLSRSNRKINLHYTMVFFWFVDILSLVYLLYKTSANSHFTKAKLQQVYDFNYYIFAIIYLKGTKKKGVRGKTIMLVGATRSGKSTLIDGMINYIFGVNWDDDFRFSLIELSDSKKKRHGDHQRTYSSACVLLISRKHTICFVSYYFTILA